MKIPASVLVSWVGLFCAPAAFAALGSDVASVQSDQATMNATVQTTNAGGYSVYELHAAGGTVVREYMSPAGTVFAVSWQGPMVPDLRLLLGQYFHDYENATQTPRPAGSGRRVEQSGLVLETGGHMRALFGRAYLSQAVPQGVSTDEIK